MKYLGVFDGHNATAALMVDGRVVGAVQEERLSRVKNDVGFPRRAVAAVLAQAGVGAGALDGVWVASHYVSRARTPEEVTAGFDRRYERQPRALLAGRLGRLRRYRRWRAASRMGERLRVLAGGGLPAERVTFTAHHETHAATAYHGLRTDDEPYLVVTMDGGGDGLSGSAWIGAGGQLHLVAELSQEDSLGELYAVTTHLLGFRPLEHEYKLMGMAPYAAPQYAEQAAAVFSRYLELDPQQPLRLRRLIPEPVARIGPRLRRDLERLRFDTVCAGLQLFTERLLAGWVAAAVRHTGLSRVLAAGGVFMNVKANKVISELPEVDYFQAFPSAGDESLPFGACYLAARRGGEAVEPLAHCYLGNDIGEAEARAAVVAAGDRVRAEAPADMAGRVAQLLADGEIVARAAGPMEFGARALGNRSILADPIHQDVVRVINQMIKKRDFWMPFAPVVRRRQAGRYFHNPKGLPSPYMMNTFDSTERRGEFMAAVHNADLTARPQLVEEGQNPAYEAILERFGERTGRDVLLNTSFNLHGYPIVCTAADAVGVLLDSGLRRLVLGPLLVTKQG
ncbi:MAG: carbamoyltransferase C-terminal domain-containing protein [Gemmatimonadota bacterium]